MKYSFILSRWFYRSVISTHLLALFHWMCTHLRLWVLLLDFHTRDTWRGGAYRRKTGDVRGGACRIETGPAGSRIMQGGVWICNLEYTGRRDEIRAMCGESRRKNIFSTPSNKHIFRESDRKYEYETGLAPTEPNVDYVPHKLRTECNAIDFSDRIKTCRQSRSIHPLKMLAEMKR